VHLFVEAHIGLEQFGIELLGLLGAPVRRIGLRRDDESHRLFSIQSGVGMGTTNGGAADRHGGRQRNRKPGRLGPLRLLRPEEGTASAART
jgi:hypothetical protein